MEFGKRPENHPDRARLFHGVPRHHYYAGLAKTRKINITRRLQKVRMSADGWAKEHLQVYIEETLKADGNIFVELGAGFGLGTLSVVERLRGFDKLFAIDIDFRCAKNIDGYARHLNLRDRLEPLAANFETLPLGDQSVDVVLTHYGLDESANISKILQEVTRVLCKGGRFIGVSRKMPFIQHRVLFDAFGFSDAELWQMACAADVYPGFEKLSEMSR